MDRDLDFYVLLECQMKEPQPFLLASGFNPSKNPHDRIKSHKASVEYLECIHPHGNNIPTALCER